MISAVEDAHLFSRHPPPAVTTQEWAIALLRSGERTLGNQDDAQVVEFHNMPRIYLEMLEVL